MRTTIDFLDKVYNILLQGGIEDEISGKVYVGHCPKVTGEVIILNSLDMDHSDSTVDVCPVNIVLLVPDIESGTNNERFRYLVKKINNVIANYKTHIHDFLQDSETNDGTVVSETIKLNQYFQLFPVFSTNPETDPERKAFSWWSIRVKCFYEQ